MKGPLRRVVQDYPVPRNGQYGATRKLVFMEQLECGHVVTHNPALPVADVRACDQCQAGK